MELANLLKICPNLQMTFVDEIYSENGRSGPAGPIFGSLEPYLSPEVTTSILNALRGLSRLGDFLSEPLKILRQLPQLKKLTFEDPKKDAHLYKSYLDQFQGFKHQSLEILCVDFNAYYPMKGEELCAFLECFPKLR